MKIIQRIVGTELRDEVDEVVLKEHCVDLASGGRKVVQTIRRTASRVPYAILECGHERKILNGMSIAGKKSIVCRVCEGVARGVEPAPPVGILYRPIDDLGMSVLATNVLKMADLYFVGDLVTKSEFVVSRLPNVGRAILAEVRNALSAKGLALGMKLSGFDVP